MRRVEKRLSRLETQRNRPHDKMQAGISTKADRKQLKYALPWRFAVFRESAKQAIVRVFLRGKSVRGSVLSPCSVQRHRQKHNETYSFLICVSCLELFSVKSERLDCRFPSALQSLMVSSSSLVWLFWSTVIVVESKSDQRGRLKYRFFHIIVTFLLPTSGQKISLQV